MISYHQALEILLSDARPLGEVQRTLAELEQEPSVLGRPLLATMDSPRFDNSAVDGYAVLAETLRGASRDHPVSLRISEVVQAGAAAHPLEPGSAARIFTGAAIPQGADAIVMQEDVHAEGERATFFEQPTSGEHVRRRSEEFANGRELLPAGVYASPPVVGLIAAMGYPSFPCAKPPRVAIVATGSELVEPGEELGEAKIFESNRHSLRAALREIGIPAGTSVVRDDAAGTREALAQALAGSDVVITTGGVSVGDFDLVKESLAELGVEERFWRVALKPGKPFFYGVHPGGAKVFGLPGNPAAALVTFLMLVRPALFKMLGADPGLGSFQATLACDVTKAAGRMELMRGVADLRPDGTSVGPAGGQVSNMLTGLANGDCLIHLPAESERLPRGTVVRATMIRWGAI